MEKKEIKTTRSFDCLYSYSYDNKKTFKAATNTTCWAQVRIIILESEKNDVYLKINYSNSVYEEYLNLITRVINNITECYVENGYIYYKIFQKDYNKNLFLLNFIRQIWYDDSKMISYRSTGKVFDSKKMFEFLKKNENKFKDKIELLFRSNIKACIGDYGIGHSNCVEKRLLKIKNYDYFNSCKPYSLHSILT